MSAPIVQVLFKGRMLKSISFEGDCLRIGRLRQNDVVIDNLSVSRFHATLTRRDGRVVLEDCGSENGCFVNGMRVERSEVKPGDEILIGKHQLVLREPGQIHADPPRPAPDGPGQPWDGQKTYMMGRETMDGLLGSQAERAPGGSAAPDPPPAADAYDVGEEELPELAEPPALEPEPRRPAGPRAAAEAAAPGTLYPGFVMQTDGRFDRVLRWETDRLVMGRSSECEIVLSHPEVSRRHALLHREGDCFEVRDLDSINGTFLNGQRVKRAELAVGDVVKVEHFEFTFVLEPQPIGNEIKTDTLPPPTAAQQRDDDLTILEDVSPLDRAAPSPLEEVTEPSPAPTARVAAVAAAPAVEAVPAATAPEVTLELRVRLDELPPALREALEDSGAESLPVRAELRLVRKDAARD